MLQFGELQPDFAEKKNYAGYRAKAIAEALQSGTRPPPPSGGASQPPAAAPAFNPAAPFNPAGPQNPPGAAPAAAAATDEKKSDGKVRYEPVHTSPPNPAWDEPRRNLGPTSTIDDYKAQARLQAQFASSALMFQDVDTALKCTNTAIQLLRAAGITPDE